MRIFPLALFAACVACTGGADAIKPDPRLGEPDTTWQALGDDLYVAIARAGGKAGSNAGVVVLPSEVLVFDAHFKVEAAEALGRELQKHFNRPVRWLVFSHHHVDHTGGRFGFPHDIEIVAHPNAAARLKAVCGASTKNCQPTRTVPNRFMLVMGGREFQILHLGRGHTDGDLVLWMPKERVLFAGDLFVRDHIGYWGDGFPREWSKTLDRVLELEPRVVVPGHGVPSDSRDVARFRDFIQFLTGAVERAAAQGQTVEQILSTLKLPPPYSFWRGQEMFMERNVRRVITERSSHKSN
ncbi:MAG: MBL fold metallo-hydrolase [Deltaproteobacteria bacterium]|nr:MBL fold metallo-hydrolase [Deltaproteobacteria bacterium]